MGVVGHTSYEGLTVQQHKDVFKVFDEFLADIKPARILEIGTAGGGLTLFLRHNLPDTPILTFERYEQIIERYQLYLKLFNRFICIVNELSSTTQIALSDQSCVN